MEKDEQEEQLHVPEERIEQLLTGTDESSELIRMSRNLWSTCRKDQPVGGPSEFDGWYTQKHLALEVQFLPFQLDHFSVTLSCKHVLCFQKKETEWLEKKNLVCLFAEKAETKLRALWDLCRINKKHGRRMEQNNCYLSPWLHWR